MSILDRLQEAVKSGNTAKILNLMPELMDAVDAGTVLELPCKVGDTVYLNSNYWGNCCKGFVYQIIYDTAWRLCVSAKSTLSGQKFHASIRRSAFGKTVFLTEAEMQKTLNRQKLKSKMIQSMREAGRKAKNQSAKTVSDSELEYTNKYGRWAKGRIK